jgi:hypothetical protein
MHARLQLPPGRFSGPGCASPNRRRDWCASPAPSVFALGRDCLEHVCLASRRAIQVRSRTARLGNPCRRNACMLTPPEPQAKTSPVRRRVDGRSDRIRTYDPLVPALAAVRESLMSAVRAESYGLERCCWPPEFQDADRLQLSVHSTTKLLACIPKTKSRELLVHMCDSPTSSTTSSGQPSWVSQTQPLVQTIRRCAGRGSAMISDFCSAWTDAATARLGAEGLRMPAKKFCSGLPGSG